MSFLRPLLVVILCSFALLHSASSLKCYDCLSAALPACLDDSKGEEFDVTTCSPEEVCSILKMRDGQGNLVVSRQCATGPEEATNVSKLLEAAMQGKLEVEDFKTCDTDECNARRQGSKGAASRTLGTGPWAALALTALFMAVLAR